MKCSDLSINHNVQPTRSLFIFVKFISPGNVSTPTRKLRTRSEPVAVGRDPQWLPSIPERFASKVTAHNKLCMALLPPKWQFLLISHASLAFMHVEFCLAQSVSRHLGHRMSALGCSL